MSAIAVAVMIMTSAVALGQTSEPQCPACIFGPQVYHRSIFAPTTERAGFGADPAADYVIDIDDMGSKGADGSVTLNGQVLLAPRTAAEVGPRHVRRAVALLAQNTLVVRLTGKAGSKLTIQVLGGTKSVGAAGGSVMVPGGGVRLDIPPLALPEDTEISISNAPGVAPPNILEGVTPLGPAWSLEPKGLVFDQPVTMSIKYGGVLSQVSSPDEIGVVHWDDSGTFADPVSAVDDPLAQELTFSLGHFSIVSIVKGASGYNTYLMRWSITPFDVDPRFEEALWAAPTRDLNYTTADRRISVVHLPSGRSFRCPPNEPFHIRDQTGMTCMPTPGFGVERVLDGRSHATIVIYDSQTTHQGEARTARMHQLGHALGIAHPWRLPLASWVSNPDVFPVMSNILAYGLPEARKLVRNDLHPVDIAAIQSKYGVGVSLPPVPVPTLLTPGPDAQIPQNDPSTGCSLLPSDPSRGYGFKIAFDWANVSGATQYRLFAKRQASIHPIVDIVVPQSAYTHLDCNAIVVGDNLTGWFWQVQAFADGRWGAFSSPRSFQFLTCLLSDGTACGTAPGNGQFLVDTGPASTDPVGGSGLFARGSTSCGPQPACAENFQFLASQFNLASGAALESVEGWLTGTFAGSLDVKIYTDNNGVPGNSIFSKTYTPGNQAFGWVNFPNFNPVLAAGTYWLSFEPVADSQFSSGMSSGAPTPLQNYAYFANDNNRWVNFGQFGQPQPGFGIRISGTLSAP